MFDSRNFRIGLILLSAALLFLLMKELGKPSETEAVEALTRQLGSENKLPDIGFATLGDVQERGLPVQSSTKLFMLILLTVGSVALTVIKVILPAIKDGLDTVFADTSAQNGWVRAKVLLEKGNHAQAIAELKRHHSENPEERRVIPEIARIQEKLLGDPKAAIATLEAAAQAAGNEADLAAFYAWTIVEKHKEVTKDEAEAKRWAEKTMELDPHSMWAGNASKYLQALQDEALRKRMNG